MNKQIYGQSLIRRNHPLAIGLVGAWLCNESVGQSVHSLINPNDIATFSNGTTGTSWLRGLPNNPYGFGGTNPGTPGSGGGAKLTSVSSGLTPTDVLSIAWYGCINSSGNTGNNPAIAGVSFSSTGASPFFAYGMFRVAAGPNDLYYAQDCGGTANFHKITGIVSTSASPVLYSQSIKSGSQIFYKNGVQVGTASDAGAISYGSGPILFIGTDFANEDPGLLNSLVLIWHRFLSQQEHQMLARDPYQILVPLFRPDRAVIAAVSSGYPAWWTGLEMPQLLPQ